MILIYKEMLMRTIIHIGQHKTATTSIQHFLQQNKAHLFSQGLYVPESIAGHTNPSHYVLNVYALNENRYSSMKELILRTKPKQYLYELHQRLYEDICRHYKLAEDRGCNDVIWSNEGLYLLNSVQEYRRLYALFSKYSSSIVCVCCFRDVQSYKKSYSQQLEKEGILPSEDFDSYRYLKNDSWLFDYSSKSKILMEVFDQVITFPFNQQDNVKAFMEEIGYPFTDKTESIRLNITKY
jgi:hypothetical protein